jgi:PAS domain S-box-containing protein
MNNKIKDNLVGVEFETSNDLLRYASQYSRSLLEAIRDPIFSINSIGIITDMNLATIRLTGLNKNNLINLNFRSLFTDDLKAQKAIDVVFESGYVIDYHLVFNNIIKTPVLFNGSVYKDESGKVIGAVVIARDITERKVFEKELTEARDYAEKASIIAEDAQKKAESLTVIAENAVKAKQQFLSNMSHEIRTPMNAIIGFTKVVLKTDLTEKQKEYLSAIKVSGDALIVLINDILDLAKVDAGKMLFEKIPFKLKSSISSMLHLFEPKIQEKNIQLKLEYDDEIPKILLGDPVRLHQIILNLVSNAVKFTSSGQIYISVKKIEEAEKMIKVEFIVRDTGIGIDKEKLTEVFSSFQQATSGTSRLYGGSGLGLSIVKHLIEQQGGNIEVESELGKGATFRYTLDFDKTLSRIVDEVDVNFLNEEKINIKVLVVEDIALNQLLMKTLLDDFGFEKDIASNGKIAIEKLKNNTYDVILMDLQMPEMNGFEATTYIRNVMNLDIPIIALTADVTTVDLAKCVDVGMNDYISKPVNEKLLKSKILTLVRKYKDSKLIIQEKMEDEYQKCIDLSYLNKLTKSNSELMLEMIDLYLTQTPPLVLEMKKSFEEKNWINLHKVIHKLIPSFSIVGIHKDFEKMAQKIQEFSDFEIQKDVIQKLVFQVENICNQACVELVSEVIKLKKTKNVKTKN